MKKVLFALVLILVLLLAANVYTEPLEAIKEAEEITSSCVFSSASNETKKNTYAFMLDQDVSTYYALKEKKGWLIIESPEPIWGISVMLYNRYGKDYSYDLQIENTNGEWETISKSKYLSNWHPLDNPATKIRIQPTSVERLRIAEIQCFGEGGKLLLDIPLCCEYNSSCFRANAGVLE